MIRIASFGHAVFALVLIAIGALFLAKGDFGAIWDGVPPGLPGRALLAGLCTAVSLASGTGLFWRRAAPLASRVLVVFVLLWMLAFKLPPVVLAPLSVAPYESWGETAVVVAGAMVLYSWFGAGAGRKWVGFATGDHGVRIARVFYGLAMLAFGAAHFAYAGETASLVPAWLPWHRGWAYFFGATYVAAGAAILGGVHARVAAALSTLQMGLFTLLVWIPAVAAGHPRPSDWSEFMTSLTLTSAGWVVADSCLRGSWPVRS